MNPRTRLFLRRQGGAATLVVVMVLFLVMALLAAYANRALLFEQRVAASYFRSSLAQEVAEAGVEWTLAQLNGAAVDDQCKPVSTGGQRFVDRYLQINPADRLISYNVPTGKVVVDCARDAANNGWSCRCPAADTTPTARAPIGGNQLAPSFRLDKLVSHRGGTAQLTVLSCTDSVPDHCAVGQLAEVSNAQLAKLSLNTTIALVSAVRSPPAAPLVVRGNIVSAGAGLGLHNTDARSAGMLASLSGQWTGRVDDRLESVPGTAIGDLVTAGPDSKLPATAEDLFKMFMGTSVTVYPRHPSLRKVSCSGDCGTALEAAYNAGKRVVWVDGPLEISSKVLGSLSDPMLIVATGDVVLQGSFELNGMLVSQGHLSWQNAFALPQRINGILLVGGGMETNGRMDIVYQQTVADQLRNRMGSFVRVPGGWSDTDGL